MKWWLRRLAACGALVLAAARASGVAPIEYRVDGKIFKATRAETELTFSVFSDAACTMLVDVTPLVAGDLSFERPKTVVAKGAGKPPKLIVLRTNLDTEATGAFYLTVTGDGIAPVGDACQPQAGGAPGPTGPQGPPGDPATALWAVVNLDGTLARGSGAVSSARLDPGFGTYEVIFDRDVTGCAYVASAGQASSGVAPDAFLSTSPRNGNANGVFLDARTSAGASVGNPFHLAVFCP
jgi:hypothetical protein